MKAAQDLGQHLLQDVLHQEARSLERAAGLMTPAVAQGVRAFFEHLIIHQSSCVLCGVGKSGLIAQKIASTFSSLGLSSWFLHPVEALHGDLGKLKDQDGIIFLSKSGTTEEILKLLPFLKQSKAQLVGLLGDVHSPIASHCGLVIDASVEKEACLNNLAPTTSTTLALALGDALAVYYESLIGLSKEAFAQHHPGGKLGKTLTLKVHHLMTPLNQCPVAGLESSMKDVLLTMTQFPTGLCAIVSEGGVLEGIIVEADIRRTLTKPGVTDVLNLKAKVLMNPNPLLIDDQAMAVDALRLMENPKRPVYVLPVVSATEKKFMGIISLHQIAQQGLS